MAEQARFSTNNLLVNVRWKWERREDSQCFFFPGEISLFSTKKLGKFCKFFFP